MQQWTVLLGVLGAAALVLLAVDIVATALSASEGAGPVSGPIARAAWRVLARGHHRSQGRWLRFAGPVVLLMAVLGWVVLLWGGWTLVFLSGPSVAHATTGAPANGWQVAYYAGFSVMTLGVGDYTATSDGWRLLTVVASFSGLFVLTLSITYLLSVLSAVVQRNALALQISAMGSSAVEIIGNGWDGARFTRTFWQQLVALGSPLAQSAEQHLTYPVLAAFHTSHRGTALSVSAADLDDAMLVLLRCVEPHARPADVPDGLRTLVERLLATTSGTRIAEGEDVPAPPDLGALRHAGVPLLEADAVAEVFAENRERRAALRRMAEGSGWSWGSPGTDD